MAACRDFVLCRLDAIAPELRERLLAGMLTELPLLAHQDDSFTQLLSRTSFVPTESGSLKSPAELYDPRWELPNTTSHQLRAAHSHVQCPEVSVTEHGCFQHIWGTLLQTVRMHATSRLPWTAVKLQLSSFSLCSHLWEVLHMVLGLIALNCSMKTLAELRLLAVLTEWLLHVGCRSLWRCWTLRRPFPSGALASSSTLLAALQQLGLQSTVKVRLALQSCSP